MKLSIQGTLNDNKYDIAFPFEGVYYRGYKARRGWVLLRQPLMFEKSLPRNNMRVSNFDLNLQII